MKALAAGTASPLERARSWNEAGKKLVERSSEGGRRDFLAPRPPGRGQRLAPEKPQGPGLTRFPAAPTPAPERWEAANLSPAPRDEGCVTPLRDKATAVHGEEPGRKDAHV